MRYAQIDAAGQVVVILEGDVSQWPDLVAAGVLREAGPEVTTEWRWDGATFVEQGVTQLVPAMVASWRIKAILVERGHYDAAEALASQAGGRVAMAWRYADEWSRSGIFVNQFATFLGLTSDDIDDIFIDAMSIDA